MVDNNMNKRLTQSELARELGVSRQYVGKLVGEKKIRLGEDKKITLVEAQEQISQFNSPPHSAGASLRYDNQDGKQLNYNKARASRESIMVALAAIELQEKRNKLFKREDVEKLFGDLIAEYRLGLDILPARITAGLPRKQAQEMRLLIAEEINVMLSNIENKFKVWGDKNKTPVVENVD